MVSKTLFSEALMQLRAGRAQEEYSEELGRMIAACRETGKKGKMTIVIDVMPDKVIEGAYIVSENMKSVIPKHDKSDTTLYGTPDNNLTAIDPEQDEIVFNTDGCNTQEVRIQ